MFGYRKNFRHSVVVMTATKPARREKASLTEQVVLVTGGSKGIGRAIVLALAREGARVAFTYLNSETEARKLVEEITAKRQQTICVKADVRDLESVRGVVTQTMERFGQLNCLVNNAGILRDKALMLMEPVDWCEVIETNLTGVYNCCRAVIVELMKQRYGKIVNISSVAGISGNARQVNYSASKAGVIGLTKALAKEVARYNITVNAVAPGFITTDMTRTLEKEAVATALKTIPMKRFGIAEEVAEVVVALLGPAGSYITGQVVAVDGGLSA